MAFSPLSTLAQIPEATDAPYQSIPVYLFASESGDILGIIPITPNLALGCISHITTSEAESLQQPPSDPICSLYRLTTASTTFATTSTDYIRTYTYSPTGNITNKSDQGNYLYQGDQGTSYANPHAVTDINGTTYTYDKNGNLTSDGIWTHSWFYTNRLATSTNGVATSTYAYDHTGTRVKMNTSSNAFIYPNKYYTVSNATTTRHIFANGQLVATIEGTGTATTTNYIHTDHLGGTHIITDEDGNKAQLLDYYPFGDLRLNETDALDEQRKFTGHEYDDDTDLTYANARYYDQGIGRFNSQDPLFLAIGTSQVKNISGMNLQALLSDPQSLGSYTYARNNPVIMVDQDGNIGVLAPLLIYGPAILATLSTMAPMIPAFVDNPRLAGSALPGTGDVIAAHEAYTGTSFATGGQLSIGERALAGFSSLPFVGLLGDASRGITKAGDTVAGLRVTKHAAEGFASRNMQTGQVSTALESGVKYLDTKTNNLLHVVGERGRGGYTVVTDHAQKALVSVENFVRNLTPKESPNRFKKVE